jgi:glycosyltransferase involved in cell wall biosynthesis
MAASPNLSVVVTSFNQQEQLARIIPQLLTQTLASERFEIIVVDDGSTDGSREWLNSLGDRAKLILAAHAGRSASRNRGIRAATGAIVVMLDGDHTVQPNFLAIHAERHHERCVIVGRSTFAEHPDFRALNHYLDNSGAAKLPPDTRLPGRYFLTRNCSVPRELLLEVGLFDENFSVWGGEDLDLGIRLEESGVPIYGEPRAVAVHHHQRPLAELLQNLYAFGRSGIPLLLAKHPRLFSELNLAHRFTSANGESRFGALHRFAFQVIFASPIFRIVRALAHALRRRRLPRSIFDYLHLREYSRGYSDHLKSTSQS